MNDIDRELFILSPEERAIRRNEVYDELKSGLLERHPSNANLVRCVNTVSEKLVISQDTITPPLPLWMPLGLHQLCDLRQKNIMHVAGRSNAGKTPFLLQMALANSHIMPTVYFSSEMDSAELSLRISLFKNGFEVWDKIDFQLRSRDFADVIRPEWANYIDYIELPADQSFIIGDILTGIHNRLTKGYAVVASQKKDGTDFGRGGEYGLEKPRIYLSMNLDTVKIIKGKWRHDPRIDPNYRECRYHTLGGALLNRDTPWTKEGEIPFMPKNEKLPKCFEMAKQEFLKDDDFALP
jgi:hypothetical protein